MNFFSVWNFLKGPSKIYLQFVGLYQIFSMFPCDTVALSKVHESEDMFHSLSSI